MFIKRLLIVAILITTLPQDAMSRECSQFDYYKALTGECSLVDENQYYEIKTKTFLFMLEHVENDEIFNDILNDRKEYLESRHLKNIEDEIYKNRQCESDENNIVNDALSIKCLEDKRGELDIYDAVDFGTLEMKRNILFLSPKILNDLLPE